ncbi:hypothetical protein V6N13_101113 [Hibiscus sabdariffa]
MFPQVFDKLPTPTDKELARDIGVTDYARKEGNEGVENGKAHITTSTGNLPIFLQSHSNSMASDILATALQSAEARDSATFLTSVPILSRYNGFALSVMKAVVSMSQPSSHVLHSAILVTGPVFKEHLYAYLYA